MTTSPEAGDRSWTVAVRERVSGLVPAGQVLPDRQPAYVASWIYVFGVLSLAALVVRHRARAWRSPWAGWPGGTPRRWATS